MLGVFSSSQVTGSYVGPNDGSSQYLPAHLLTVRNATPPPRIRERGESTVRRKELLWLLADGRWSFPASLTCALFSQVSFLSIKAQTDTYAYHLEFIHLGITQKYTALRSRIPIPLSPLRHAVNTFAAFYRKAWFMIYRISGHIDPTGHRVHRSARNVTRN